MTYDPTQPENLPPPNTGILSVRDNFLAYSQVFDNNHVALNANNQGKHTNVILQQQGSDPTVEGSFDSLYSAVALTSIGPTLEVFARIPQFLPLDKPNNPEQLTFHVVNTAGPQYQSFLPGGYIIYFGTIAGGSAINSTITLVPAPSEILCVIPNPSKLSPLTGIGPNAPQRISVTIDNASQFTINAVNPFPGGTGTIRWLAIAKQ